MTENLMQRLLEAEQAEGELEEALLIAFGVLGPLGEYEESRYDANLWFNDWYFDTYDSSVELLAAEVGKEPSPECLAKLLAAGIHKVYISYRDGTARLWTYLAASQDWTDGPCSPRSRETDRGQLLRAALREVEKLSQALARAHVMARRAARAETGEEAMKLTLRKSEASDDWYVIERAEHDGKEWMEPTGPNTSTLRCSARFSDADVEGTAAEMLAVARAIRARSVVAFRRCAVDATSEPVRFDSPRNSTKDGECSYAEALELAEEIMGLLGREAAKGGPL